VPGALGPERAGAPGPGCRRAGAGVQARRGRGAGAPGPGCAGGAFMIVARNGQIAPETGHDHGTTASGRRGVRGACAWGGVCARGKRTLGGAVRLREADILHASTAGNGGVDVGGAFTSLERKADWLVVAVRRLAGVEADFRHSGTACGGVLRRGCGIQVVRATWMWHPRLMRRPARAWNWLGLEARASGGTGGVGGVVPQGAGLWRGAGVAVVARGGTAGGGDAGWQARGRGARGGRHGAARAGRGAARAGRRARGVGRRARGARGRGCG